MLFFSITGQYGDDPANIAPDEISGEPAAKTCLPCVSGKVGESAGLAFRGDCVRWKIKKWKFCNCVTTISSNYRYCDFYQFIPLLLSSL